MTRFLHRIYSRRNRKGHDYLDSSSVRSRKFTSPTNFLKANDDAGSALIEGAIIVPVLCVLLFGVYEFSWFFYQQHLVSTGLRDAARYLARVPASCNPTSPDWPSDQVNARNLATTGAIGGGTARVKGWSAASVRLDCTPVNNPVGASGLNAYRGGRVIYVVTASTRFADPALGFFAFLGLKTPAISVFHSERVIGPG